MTNTDFKNSQRNTIWNKYYGNSNSAIDVFGRKMNKSDFECDHVYPKSHGGETVIANGLPLHPKSNLEKSDNLWGTVNGKNFRVSGYLDSGLLTVNGNIVTK